MKFIHVGGDIADFGGHTFMFRNPVDVTNRATIASLLKNPKFRKFENEKEIEIPKEKKVLTEGKACSKCGKVLRQGIYLHEKYCKG